MRQPNPLLDQARLREMLTMVLDHAMPACAQIPYRLVGTGAALLHGVQLPTGDIDILVKERKDVDAFGSTLSCFKCLFPPTWLPEARQYYANYEVNGIEVEISTVEVETDSDVLETIGRGPWEHFSLIPCGPYAVPTVALELRLITELARQRPDRYTPIIQFMQVNGCDIELIRRGMEITRLPQASREDVLNQLQGTSAS
jgi:hypothetical protein